MKTSVGILLGLALLAGASLSYARGGGHGGGGGGHFAGRAGGGMTHTGMTGGFTRFTTGAPTQFTTGHPPVPMHPISGVRPGPIVPGRPPFHRHVVVGGAVFIGAPLFYYPPYPYPYYPYVAPAYGGSGYTEPAYVEQGGGVAYYCPDYQDYYPNVTSCPSQWMQVLPGGPGTAPAN